MSHELIKNLLKEIKTTKEDLTRYENEIRYFRYLLSNTINPIWKNNYIRAISVLKELIDIQYKNLVKFNLMLENVIC